MDFEFLMLRPNLIPTYFETQIWIRPFLAHRIRSYQNKPIWSVGGGWNINNESFFDVDWVDALKLRGSYGIAGNIAKDSAPYLTATYSANPNVGGTQGSVGKRPNPELSWEKTTTTNIGFDNLPVIRHY